MLLFLDDYHLGDPLFLTGLAQDIAASKRPALMLHVGREASATALEATGTLDPDAVLYGPLGEHSPVVERALRDQNRAIAAALTEAGVAAVRLLASDRGLVRLGSAGLELGDGRWINTLLMQRTCVVLAALAETPSGAHLLDPGLLASSLGRDLGLPVVGLTTGRVPGLLIDGGVAEVAEIATLEGRSDVPDAEVLRAVVARGGEAVVTSRGGAFDPAQAQGTRLVPNRSSAPSVP